MIKIKAKASISSRKSQSIEQFKIKFGERIDENAKFSCKRGLHMKKSWKLMY